MPGGALQGDFFPTTTMNPADLEKLRIILYPDPALARLCAPVETFDDDLQALSGRLLAVMKEANGVGLAAPQLGVLLRVFVCNPAAEPGADLVCVNPRFVELTGAEVKDEGCLSIPDVTVAMRRATCAVMEASDVEGKPFTKTGEDLVARVWQHEADHLDGRLITDNMSPTDVISNRRAVKQLEQDYPVAHRL